MPYIRFSLQASLLICMVVFVARARADVDTRLLQLLEQEAQPAWDSLEKKLADLDIDVSYVGIYRTGSTKELFEQEHTNFRFAFDTKRRVSLLRRHDTTTPQSMSHDVANNRYNFNIFVKDSSQRGTLHSLHPIRSQSQGTPLNEILPGWHHRDFLFASCRIGERRASDFLDENQFLIQQLYEAADSSGIVVLVCQMLKSDVVFEIHFDPSYEYRVHACRIVEGDGTTIQSSSFRYFEEPDIVIPQKMTFTHTVSKTVSQQEYTFDIPKPCDIPDEEFYLPHYGISEAVLETLHPNPWPRWILTGLGIAALAVGAWLFRGKPRPRTQDS